MIFRKIFILLCFYATIATSYSQISYGGMPFPINSDTQTTRLTNNKASEQANTIPFVEMPTFNIEQAKSRSAENMAHFKSLEFAHKFFVKLNPKNSGTTFTTNENINVWRIGIRSKKAFSINILFSKFKIPNGAKLFIYNAKQTEILGAYTHQNNSDIDILPVQPISGDELIVEYQEPNNAPFKGEIEIGEVNHDFINILKNGVEPRDPLQSCHKNIACLPEDIKAGQGVVALIINGNIYCTGSLVNNSKNDGTPYLLTATHCLNNNYKSSFLHKRHYDKIAGSIVAFFGYQSPICKTPDVRGPIQMTLASADSVLISEPNDISLLKFKNIPPAEYQPIYLGWNLSTSPSAPFHGLHHPNGGIKKVAINNNKLAIGTFDGISNLQGMQPMRHWILKAWNIGATEGGSSGSPLLDNNKLIVGTLTGGISMCGSPKGPDYYAALYRAWDEKGLLGNNKSLKDYLNPTNENIQQLESFDYYKNYPHKKLRNYNLLDSIEQAKQNSTPVFATNNALGHTEFAEQFNTTSPTNINGVYVASMPTNKFYTTNIKIRVYSDNNNTPGTILYETKLNNSFQYRLGSGFSIGMRNMNYYTENYTKFNNPIIVSGKFYISVLDTNGQPEGFTVLNVKPRAEISYKNSSTWVKKYGQWFNFSKITSSPKSAPLFIAPLITGKDASTPNIDSQKTMLKTAFDRKTKIAAIESNRKIFSWKIFNSLGQLYMSETTSGTTTKIYISMPDLPRGVYILQVQVQGSTQVGKILVM